MRRLGFLLLAWLGLASTLPGAASAYCLSRTDSTTAPPCDETDGTPRDALQLTWQRGCMRYAFNERVFERLPALTEDQVRNIFEQSFATWRAVDCGGDPFYVQQLGDTTPAFGGEFITGVRNESVITVFTGEEWAMADAAHSPLAIALTLVWHNLRTGEIYDVDMDINGGMGTFGDCGEERCTGDVIDLRNTVTHEAGHVLGLGHSLVPESTMAPNTDPSAIHMRTLETDDATGLCAADLPSHDCDDPAACVCPDPGVLGVTRTKSGCSVAHAGRSEGGTLALLLLAALARRRR
jgi:MYXO-CTERM domain-containing protein